MRYRNDSSRDSRSPGWRATRPTSAVFRMRPVVLLIGAAIISYGLYRHFSATVADTSAATDIRMPITNAPLEPDRPDLIGEPRIDESHLEDGR